MQAVVELVKALWAIPSAEARDKLVRYQTMLGNGLYEALKALRELQQRRMAAIEVADDAGVVVTEGSA
jgi:hypothetical protein